MVVEQQNQLSPEKAAIRNLAIDYFDNASVALFYERGLAVKPLDGKLRQVIEDHAAERNKHYNQLVKKVVECLMIPNGKVSFDKIIEQSIDLNHGSVRSFEEHGGSFSGWLHQLKSDTINAMSGIALKLIENSGVDKTVEERRALVEQLIAKVLSGEKPN